MTKQSELEEYLEATYLVRKSVAKRDLGIINQSSFYRNFKKKDRNYNNGVDHAKNDLKLLQFFLVNMKPLYRNKILQSDEFQNVLKQTMDIGVGNFNDFTKEEKDRSLAFTVQLFTYCLEVMSKNMPKEFINPLLHYIEPLNDLVQSIYTFMQKSNEKTIPPFREISFPITNRR